MNIIANRKIFYIISGALMLASIIAIAVFGLKLGTDFTGGSLLEVEYSGERPDSQVIHEQLAQFNLGNILVQQTGERGVILRFKDVGEETHQKILGALRGTDVLPNEEKTEEFGPLPAMPQSGNGFKIIEKRFNAIGPVIGNELKRRSVFAILLVLGFIVIYIAWSFRRVSKPVSSWKYGIVAIAALIHDVLIPAGIFSLLGKYGGVEVDALFVTALLTILGFSVHDTIVVFDRVRENLHKYKGREFSEFEMTVEKSVKETVVRSITTSFTVLLSLIVVFFWGGESVKYFSLVLILGVVFGVYSSIFIASPLLVTWQKWNR